MTKFRILFVDDDEVRIREPWSQELRIAGYDVHACASEKAAKAFIRDHPDDFDIAVIDLNLRNIDGDQSGLEVAKAIKGKKPVIILTGGDDTRGIASALNSGVAARFIHKVQDGLDGLIEAIRQTVVHKVFVAHGHDIDLRDEVVVFLRLLGLDPIVIDQTATEGLTIVESVEKYSNVSFAVVILTPDDVGGEARVDTSLRPRARQNVILEWGFFIGRLGRDRVTALYKNNGNELELPSNQGGLRYHKIETGGKWRGGLVRELEIAGIPVDAARVKV